MIVWLHSLFFPLMWCFLGLKHSMKFFYLFFYCCTWYYNVPDVRLQFLPLGKNWQDSSYWGKLVAFFISIKKIPPETAIPDGNNSPLTSLRRAVKMDFWTTQLPDRPLRSPSQFAVWQTGADYKFYYHFNDAILAVRPALTRLPLANVLKTSPILQDWSRTDESLHHLRVCSSIRPPPFP